MAVANNDGRAIVGTTPSEAAAEVCRAGEGSRRLGMSLKVPKVGPDQAHSCFGKLMIGPDNNHTFFTKNSDLVRKKSYLGRFWAPIWSGFLIRPPPLLPGVLYVYVAEKMAQHQ